MSSVVLVDEACELTDCGRSTSTAFVSERLAGATEKLL